MSYTGRRLAALAEHLRTARLTCHQRAEFEHRARVMAEYLIGRFA